MCTTLLVHVGKRDALDVLPDIVHTLAAKSGLMASFESKDMEPHRSLLKSDLNIEGGIDFVMSVGGIGDCSCDVVRDIQEASTSVPPTTPRFIRFVRDLHKAISTAPLVVLFSEDDPPKFVQKEGVLAAFEEAVMQHYGWHTKEELKAWVYDMNMAFTIQGA